MSFMERTLKLGAVGLVAGVILGLAAPPSKLAAEGGCKCEDTGSGAWQCNTAETNCIVGSQKCDLDCET